MSRMKNKNGELAAMRRGSVMMEFIIVFPIYLVLFATTFILGDMLIHSNRLAFGDVANAFVGNLAGSLHVDRSQGVLDYYRDNVLHVSEGNDQISKTLDLTRRRFFADENGSWSECSASTFGIGYKPSVGGALGQLLAVEALLGGTPHRADSARSAVDDWRDGGYAAMKSRGGNVLFRDVFGAENDAKSQSFYVLKRNRDGHYEEGNWRWMTSGLLVGDRWRDEVLADGWHTGKTVTNMKTNPGRDTGRNIGGYARYDKFRDVSD